MGLLDRMRLDTVGSLLRPQALVTATTDHRLGRIPERDLRRLQDEAIIEALRGQESVGLPVVGDGEFRRNMFMDSFADVVGFDDMVANVWSAHAQRTLDRAATDMTAAPSASTRTVATERLRLERNRPREEYEFASAHTHLPVKTTVIGPDRLLAMFDAGGSQRIYPDADDFLADVVRVEREIVGGLIAAGCTYIQIDAPGFTSYVDPSTLGRMRSEGTKPTELLQRSIEAENAVVEGFPGVTFGIHICRGNEQGHWHREGSYDGIAEQLFSQLRHQRVLIEYDTERAGTFAALRYVPDTTTVVLGLVTTKSGAVETVDHLRRRIDEAAQVIPLERLSISPQCGFASTVEGNPLTHQEQWRKFDVLARTAELVWQ